MKITKIIEEGLIFEDGYSIYSQHDSNCCEYHWLSTGDLPIDFSSDESKLKQRLLDLAELKKEGD